MLKSGIIEDEGYSIYFGQNAIKFVINMFLIKNFSKSFNREGYVIKIRAKKYTKGIAINGKELGAFKNQKEWLLGENQAYVTKVIDEKNRIIEIELL